MSETVEAPSSASNLYERLKAGLEGEAGQSWREADRYAHSLQQTYSKLADDAELSDEGKTAKAQAAYERLAPQVVAKRKRARETAQKEAQRLERSSVPMPEGFSLGALKIANASELGAIQAETANLLHTVETKRAKIGSTQMAQDGKQQRVDPATRLLREKYAAALEGSGIEARVQAYAVLKAAEALDIDREDLVDGFRADRHRDALDQARRYQLAADSITSAAPKPPKALGTTRNRGGGNKHTGRSQAMTISRKKSVFAPKRQRSWS
jgi:hypothetical protein